MKARENAIMRRTQFLSPLSPSVALDSWPHSHNHVSPCLRTCWWWRGARVSWFIFFNFVFAPLAWCAQYFRHWDWCSPKSVWNPFSVYTPPSTFVCTHELLILQFIIFIFATVFGEKWFLSYWHERDDISLATTRLQFDTFSDIELPRVTISTGMYVYWKCVSGPTLGS